MSVIHNTIKKLTNETVNYRYIIEDKKLLDILDKVNSNKMMQEFIYNRIMGVINDIDKKYKMKMFKYLTLELFMSVCGICSKLDKLIQKSKSKPTYYQELMNKITDSVNNESDIEISDSDE
jgi:hypothetical protein